MPQSLLPDHAIIASKRERGCRREMGMQHCARAAARCRDGVAAAAGGFGDLLPFKNEKKKKSLNHSLNY
jgi:hypothetical protein